MQRVEKALKALPGVESAAVNHTEGSHGPGDRRRVAADALAAAVRKAGYDDVPTRAASSCRSRDDLRPASRGSRRRC